MKRIILFLLFALLAFPPPSGAESYGVYSDLPKAGDQGWATLTRQSFKDVSDVYTVEHNTDGTHQAGITASEWKSVTSSVTYVSGSSFSVADTYEAQFTAGRKVYVDQAIDAVCSVASTSTAASVTTVTVGGCVLSDGTEATTVTSPISSVSVGIVTSISAPVMTGRNGLINGGFQIWQTGTSGTATSNTYGPDQWKFSNYGNCSFAQYAGVAEGSQYGLKYGRDNGSATAGAVGVYNALESRDSYRYRGKTVTFSVYLKAGANFSPTSNNVTLQILTGTGTDENPATSWTGGATVASEAKSITTTMTRYSVTGTVGASVTQIRVAVYWTPTGTSGADDNVYIEQAQLEMTSAPTPFEWENYSAMLAKAQRYYEIIGGTTLADIYFRQYMSGVQTWGSAIFYKVEKRIAPTVTVVGTWSTINTSVPVAGNAGKTSCNMSSTSSGSGIVQFYTAGTSTYLTIDARM